MYVCHKIFANGDSILNFALNCKSYSQWQRLYNFPIVPLLIATCHLAYFIIVLTLFIGFMISSAKFGQFAFAKSSTEMAL